MIGSSAAAPARRSARASSQEGLIYEICLRGFGEICRKPKHGLYKKALLTLTKLIYPPIIPVDIEITPNYREKRTL